MRSGTEEKTDAKESVKITDYLKPYLPRMAGSLAVKAGGTLCDLGIPWILAYIIDTVLPGKEISLVLLWGLMMVLCSLFAWLGNITANRLASAVARDVTRTVRSDLFRKIASLSNRNVDQFTVSSLISRMTSDTYVIHQTVGMIQRIGIRAPILLIGGILITLTLDPVLTLVMMGTLPIAGIVTMIVSRKGVKLYRTVQKAADKMLMVVRENVSGIRVIKALSKSGYERSRFAKINGELTEDEQTAAKAMAVIDPTITIVLNLGLVAVILVGALRINAGLSEIGKIIAFMNYFTLILQSIMALTRIFTMLSRASGLGGKNHGGHELPPELYEPENLYTEKNGEEPYIRFDHVDFKYSTGSFMLRDINLAVKKGETLGIIGATGSGKTSLIQALMRFYDVKSGSIRIEGVDIREYSTRELRKKFGVAFQNDTLFQDTIRENIVFGREEAELDKAARIAQADEFIAEQGGYDAPVAIKGANLSGGQKQRLLIARAVAAKPDILILDDSSSALDYRTDAAMREQIRTHLKDTTKIIIAQRISSIMHAETIAVMDGGRIIGLGTHEYLMETCPLYREIGVSQIGGE